MISITNNVQEKLEHNRDLLAPMNKVMSKLNSLHTINNQQSNVRVLSSDLSVIREGTLRVFFTQDKNNNVVILDVAESKDL
ncbi:hypothetical protein [Acinetobacter sp.]|uniref:hypothetical protein n=1 Tax=Acinetobacter sp. TaxID=472 RepID=UPI002956E8CA|nr:hypothetical protein [Acinetobacter baumannii]